MHLVIKFGGTSVGSLERIENAARKVIEKVKEGYKVVVVSSAMAGETDRLINLARQLDNFPPEREVDMLISTGEQQAIALFAITLNKLGYPAVSLCGWQVPIITDHVHTKARVRKVGIQRIKNLLKEGYIPVVAGFQGVTEDWEITTLGRGGSDLSAVVLAHALGADCEIYTDVEGVFTADPRIVPQARKIPRISYEEMLEMASLGAKVMQARSIEFAMKYNVRIHVRSSFSDVEGTWILPEEEVMEKVAVRAITLDTKESRITVVRVPDRPGIAYSIFKALGDAHIVVDMIVQNVSHQGYTDMSFTVNKTDADLAESIVRKVAGDIGAQEVVRDDHVAKISVVGIGMKSSYGTAAKMFEVLYRNNINIMAISTSEIKISCLIESKYGELAVRELHSAFIEEGEEVKVINET
ncbi:aspartate kinase [Hydrogenobacter thermophilus TK-6]|uniref:Aspartokinase n=1 Tax=Hydrogenobacter thermophilus (strain DSM 6534 / IAM 12695 / TK-6) TaxID=608538 RepID=D3DGF2_HYDTT|nr:aspartate kinase [Hydrogenobacter thermophilus]ADO44839.1 aspartate kinase [Hydrogenobacter thermophilus TK-6]BAI68904.1 aspartokinase [Hydrogenobacter thermophilus TK-6]